MARFYFKAKNTDNKIVEGHITAVSEAEVRTRLRAANYDPVNIKNMDKPKVIKRGKSSGGAVKAKDLLIFSRQFSVLIESGVPVAESIRCLTESTANSSLKKTLLSIMDDIEKGKKLTEAFGKYPKSFDKLYVSLLGAGEEGGVLEEVLQRLALYIEKSTKLKNKTMSAMLYPAVAVVVSIIVVCILLTFVIPKFQDLFTSQGGTLPWLTQKVIDVSESMREHWYLLAMMPILLVCLNYSIKNFTSVRRVFDKILLKIPVIKNLVIKSAVAKISRTLSTLLRAGIRIIDAIDIAAATSGNSVIEDVLKKSKKTVSLGKPFYEGLAASTVIPVMMVQMVSIGEQTGNMEVMLSKVADFYEDEVETAAEAVTSLIEPLLIVVLGGVIGTLVIAMFLPIFNLAGTVQT